MYLALYRKYRPRTFDDVISQEHITTTLKNQIVSGSAAHAYLFTGSRGTGKTTCAKILAMAVNCLSPKGGSPCLECERCREILDGTTTDIVEMDAASNNGVDDVRQLRDEVAYTPVSCKYRVYIIDEVHMLSIAAFNALLKTLEEPPPHVKFILATTELHKVPATIVSRCQRFEFRRVDIGDSAKRLSEVAQKENVTLDPDAAELISRLSDGGMRDALSVLDRCISASGHITSEIVRDCAGVADDRHLFALSEMAAKKDAAGCIRLLNELHKGSKDVARIIDELSGHFRDLMLCKAAPADRDLLSVMPGEYGELSRIAEMYSLGEIFRCLTLLQQCADGIGKVKQRKTLAEMCLVKMCMDAAEAQSFEESAARPAQKSVPDIQIREIPQEKFVPTPPEHMSQADMINIGKTRALFEETARLAGEQPAGAFAEPPELGAPPPADNDAAQPGYGAEHFYDDSYPIADSAESANVPPSETESVPEPQKPQKGLESVSEERWRQAVESIAQADFAMGAALRGSLAEVTEGQLVIRSSSQMLINNVKGDELKRYEKEISAALGAEVRIRIEKSCSAGGENDRSKLDKLLDKARRLGIEIDARALM